MRATMSQNTLNSKISLLIAIFNRALEDKLITREQFEGYKRPGEEEKIPEYLEEKEIESFYEVTRSIGSEQIKTSGYYFLLSCHAGYRISDLFSFVYEERVKGNKIILRAKKNGNIVSIPIYPKLAEILDYCRNYRLKVSEQQMRENVKAIAKLAGIHGRNIKVHSGRHSFAMLMLEKGLTVDEVAELLGDSVDIARRYARITNSHLHNRILKLMGDNMPPTNHESSK